MGNEWSEERKAAASEAYAKRSAAKKSAETKDRVRIPLGAKRDILNVQGTPEGFVDRVVNDTPGRIDRFKAAGYEVVEEAQLGTSHVDGNSSGQGAATKDVGKGINAVVMRQREDFYKEDQAAKQAKIDETENAMRRKKVNSNESNDGTYGEVKIG